jgi:hypothetical protein
MIDSDAAWVAAEAEAEVEIEQEMEDRGVNRLMQQGMSREDAERITQEAMDAPLPDPPSFDDL